MSTRRSQKQFYSKYWVRLRRLIDILKLYQCLINQIVTKKYLFFGVCRPKSSSAKNSLERKQVNWLTAPRDFIIFDPSTMLGTYGAGTINRIFRICFCFLCSLMQQRNGNPPIGGRCICVALSLGLLENITQPFKKSFPVFIVFEDIATFNPSCDYML